MVTPLRLRAEDLEDITVLAACLQDATVKRSDMIWQPRQRRFALLLHRFRWEDERRSAPRRLGAKPHMRNQAGLHFDSVLRVRHQGLGNSKAGDVLELLSILAEPGEDAAAELTLVFSGGGAVRLDVECIEAELQDVGSPFPVLRVPKHKDMDRQ